MRERLRCQLSASVFVILQNQHELCMLTRIGTGWLAGSFNIPAGGLEAGETLPAAAVREAREEIGVNIASENLHYAHTLHSRTEGRTWLRHFFQATKWNGIPMLCEPDKHSDLQWRCINDLPLETLSYVRQAIECVAAKVSYSEYGWDDGGMMLPHKCHEMGITINDPSVFTPDRCQITASMQPLEVSR